MVKKRRVMMKILSNAEYENLLKQERYYKNQVEDLDSMKKDLEKKSTELDEVKDKFIKSEKERFEFEEKKLVAAYEDKLSQSINELKQKHMEEMNALRTKLETENHAKLEKMMEANYQKLSESMTKLHEEGNASTKHMADMSKEIIRAVGLQGVNTSRMVTENVDN